MKRSTANWTTAIAASALLAMPVGSWAQQASPTPSQTSRPAGAQADQKGSANEHLRQAEAALNDIPAASLTGTAKTKVAELKRHIATLNKSAGKPASAPAGKANWSTDVAAADRILTDLLGAGSTTGATGTSGATAAKPAEQDRSGHARRDGQGQASGSAHAPHRVRRVDERRQQRAGREHAER